MKTRISNWSPVLVKGAMWIMSSMLIAFLGQTESLTPDKLAMYTWLDYIKLPVQVLLAGLATAMAFMDQIIARHTTKLESEGKIDPTPNVTVQQVKHIPI